MLLGAGGGAAAPVTLLSDTFTDTNGVLLANHTMDLGPGWTVLEGTSANMTIDSNQAKCVTSNPGTIVADAGDADVTLYYSGYFASGEAVGGIVRATDADNYWLADVGTGNVILYEKNAGGFTNRAAHGAGVSASVYHEVVITAIGQTITVTVDGTISIQYASASFQATATKHGLRFGGAGTDLRYADTFRVDAGNTAPT